LSDILRINTPCVEYLTPMEIIKRKNMSDRKPFYQSNNGGTLSRDGKKIYFFGVIDIFTQYG